MNLAHAEFPNPRPRYSSGVLPRISSWRCRRPDCPPSTRDRSRCQTPSTIPTVPTVRRAAFSRGKLARIGVARKSRLPRRRRECAERTRTSHRPTPSPVAAAPPLPRRGPASRQADRHRPGPCLPQAGCGKPRGTDRRRERARLRQHLLGSPSRRKGPRNPSPRPNNHLTTPTPAAAGLTPAAAGGRTGSVHRS